MGFGAWLQTLLDSIRDPPTLDDPTPETNERNPGETVAGTWRNGKGENGRGEMKGVYAISPVAFLRDLRRVDRRLRDVAFRMAQAVGHLQGVCDCAGGAVPEEVRRVVRANQRFALEVLRLSRRMPSIAFRAGPPRRARHGTRFPTSRDSAGASCAGSSRISGQKQGKTRGLA